MVQFLGCSAFKYKVSLCSPGWLGPTCLCHPSDNTNVLMWNVLWRVNTYGVHFTLNRLKELRKGPLLWLVFYLGALDRHPHSLNPIRVSNGAFIFPMGC